MFQNTIHPKSPRGDSQLKIRLNGINHRGAIFYRTTIGLHQQPDSGPWRKACSLLEPVPERHFRNAIAVPTSRARRTRDAGRSSQPPGPSRGPDALAPSEHELVFFHPTLDPASGVPSVGRRERNLLAPFGLSSHAGDRSHPAERPERRRGPPRRRMRDRPPPSPRFMVPDERRPRHRAGPETRSPTRREERPA